MTERWLTTQEVAEILGVNVWTVRKWASEGKLHGLLAGRRAGWRFPPRALDQMLQEQVKATRLRQGLPPMGKREDE
jgi:excisionase family DNA binding protein